ncbi:MAG: hypothetical protein C5B54_04570 [Acidobacteria bacterium]|nr:MAG: hypothetical protein C5B54_04570 [Acidobacteriota bacterium]
MGASIGTPLFVMTRLKAALVVILCSFVEISFAAASARYNVLLISIDTLRADHLGCYGYSKTTPAIDALAAKAVVFEQAISQVPLTLPSHCTIMTGQYPNQHGVRNNENFVLPASSKTLASVFRENGYNTGAVVGSFSLDSIFGINQGFQFYEDQIGKSHDPETERYVERKAETVWKLGSKWIDAQKGPWFCFLHFFDPHAAYAPPPPFPQNYDGEIAYVDKVIGEIGSYLQEKNLLYTTIVVLLSDHGEALGEHGEASHGVFLYDATTHVPLMIVAPGFKPTRIKNQVRLVDVAPTIVDLAGLQKKPAYSGESLIADMNGAGKELPAYSETYYTNLLMGWAPLHSIRENGKKWIDAPKAELYDLQHDPKELKNLYSPSAVPQEFKTELQRHVPEATASAPLKNYSVDPEVQEKLASLGYVTGGSAVPVNSSFDPKDGIEVWGKIEDAVQAEQTGQLEKSKQLFLEALKKQPDNVMAKKFLAATLQKAGQDQEAIQYLQSALKSGLHRNDTMYQLAQAYYGLQQYDQVVKQLDSLLQIDPQNPKALKMAALASMHLKQYPAAAKYFERQLAIKPADYESLTDYARVLSYLQDDQKALAVYEKLASYRPLTEEEAIQVAAIYLTSQKLDAAEKYFELAVKANSKSIPAWKGLALIHASRREWPQAVQAFVEANSCAEANKIVQQAASEIPSNVMSQFHQKCQ